MKQNILLFSFFIFIILALNSSYKCFAKNISESDIQYFSEYLSDIKTSGLEISEESEKQVNNNDTFLLKDAVSRAVIYYPTVKQAQENIDVARINKKMQSDVYLPSLSGTASYLWLDPISQLTIGDQTVHIQSHHNANFGISVNQLIWDFGKSRPKIEAAKLEYEVAELEKQQLIQNLSLQTISSYLMTAYTRYSINVKMKQFEDYAILLQQTEIKRNSGSATNFDYLNTSSGLNAIKTELIALKTAKEKQYVSLSLLTDTVVTDNTILSFNNIGFDEENSLDNLISEALDNRIEMKILSKQYEIAMEQKRIDDRLFNPELSVSASLGAKNGYEPSLGDLRFNYSAGATLSIPIYEGNRRFQQRALGKIGINKAVTAIDIAKKEISGQVADSYLSLVSSYAKIQQLKVQRDVATKAYEQAKVNYASGAITNLELLTSSTNAVNSELFLLQEQINYQINYYKLKIATGVIIDNLIYNE